MSRLGEQLDASPAGRLVADAAGCSDCHVCEMVCTLVHEGDAAPASARLTVARDPFVDDHAEVRLCRQCADAACQAACPSGAIAPDPRTHAPVVDAAACDGCGACESACDAGMIRVDPRSGVAGKCDLCGGDPQCVAYCPPQILSYRERGAT